MDYILYGMVLVGILGFLAWYFIFRTRTNAPGTPIPDTANKVDGTARSFQAVHGTPIPDAVNCAALTVDGHMDSENSDEPETFYARIFDNPSTDPTVIPRTTWEDWEVASHTFPSGVNFHLTGVSKQAGASGQVLVAVWCVYDDDDDQGPGFAEFTCNGSGNAEMLAGRSGGPAAQQVTDTAPLQCTVVAEGFGPSVVTAFNHAWQLVYRGGARGMLWDNGGDGIREPRVELATERLFGSAWRLTFRIGEIAVTYTKAAEEWQALAANTFQSANAEGVHEELVLPSSITVVPA